MISLKLTAEYNDEATARIIYEATEPDNFECISTELSGNVIRFFIEADNAGTLRNAADDLLACIRIAEEASGIVLAASDLDGDAFSE